MKKYSFLFIAIFVVSLNNIAITQDTGKWSWYNPLPHGNGLNDCSAVDSLNCWACGNFGTIMRTSDGGKNWEVLRTSPEDPRDSYSKIIFLDLERGFVIKNKGFLYKTTNGGKTWDLVELETDSHSSYDIKFIENKYGWLSTGAGEVLFTENGGENWNLVGKIENKSISSLFFFDRYNGWAVIFSEEGEMYKTTDGGVTWKLHSFNADPQILYIRYITFANKNTGFIECAYFSGDSYYGGSLYYTTDGGNNWQYLTEPVLMKESYVLNNKILVTGGHLFSIDLNDFTVEQLEYDNKIFERGITFADSLHGWVIGSGAILHTADGGKTWNDQFTRRFGHVRDIFFSDRYNGWLATVTHYYPNRQVKNVIVNLTNGGEEVNYYNIDPSLILRQLYFINENTGYAYVYSGSHNTSVLKLKKEFSKEDGGYALRIEDTGGDLHSAPHWARICFIDENEGWLVGTKIIHTTDGGKSWEIQYERAGTFFNSCFFIDSQYGWADAGRTLVRTADGGKNWEIIPSPDNMYIQGFEFTDKDYGWIIGNHIYRTTDGGTTWENMDFASATYNYVDFVSRDIGYVLCRDLLGDKVYKTTNGGETWSGTNVLGAMLREIFFTSEYDGWALGDMGTLLKYSKDTGTAIKTKSAPASFILYGNYPNPFNNETTIKISLPGEGNAEVKIYSILGEEIRQLSSDFYGRGTHFVKWDGRDNRSNSVSSGIYIVRVTYKGVSQAKKILFIK